MWLPRHRSLLFVDGRIVDNVELQCANRFILDCTLSIAPSPSSVYLLLRGLLLLCRFFPSFYFCVYFCIYFCSSVFIRFIIKLAGQRKEDKIKI